MAKIPISEALKRDQDVDQTKLPHPLSCEKPPIITEPPAVSVL